MLLVPTLDAVPPQISAPAPIIITGRALPPSKADRAFHVELLTREQLTADPSHRLDSILQQVSGFQLFRRSDSGSGHPTSQGVTLRALGGTASSRALLVLDGVPQSDPFGGWINWPAYDPASLAEIRVVRGGGLVAYGPGAVAGAIEMTSLAEESLAGSIEVGTRRSVDGHVYLGEPIGNGLLTVSAQAGRSDGFVPLTKATRGPVDRAAPYAEANFRSRFVTPVGPDLELQLGGLAFVDRRERGVPFSANRTRGADLSARLVGKGAWRLAVTAYAQWRNLRSSFASVSDDRTDAERVSLQYSVPSDSQGASFEVRPPLPFELRLGASARRSSGRSKELYAYADGDPTRHRVSGGESSTEGVFAEASWSKGRLTLNGGARIDHWRISNGKLVERLLGGGFTRDDRYSARSGWQPTARASAVLDFGLPASFRAAVYRGWRLPTLNELFRPFRAGRDATAANAFLDPEELRGAEVGVDLNKGPTSLSLTAFANRLNHAIANVTLGHGPGFFPGVGFVAGEYRQRRNIGSVRVQGLELSASTRRGPWEVRLEGSFADPRMHDAGALDGLRPAQTPTFALAATLGWDKGGRRLALSLRHVSGQFEDDLNSRRLAPATTVGAFAAWPLGRRLVLTGRIENLFNARIMAGRGEDGTVERATPRTMWIGMLVR